MNTDKILVRTLLYLQHQLERASRKEDMSISQYRMLYFLMRGPRRAAELAVESSIRKPSITSLVGTLESRGWITRTEDPDDRRALCIEITPVGLEAFNRFEASMHESMQRFLGEEGVAEAEAALIPLYQLWTRKRDARYEDWVRKTESGKG
ncbi:MAG: MarR family transcriptional regulator [Pseudomonadales bacterium]|nr:MarR family transcriptional regulator [Pseudomonadales bacterium]